MAKRYKFKVGQEVRVKYGIRGIPSNRTGILGGMEQKEGQIHIICYRVRDRGAIPREDAYRLQGSVYLWAEGWLEEPNYQLSQKVVGSIYG